MSTQIPDNLLDEPPSQGTQDNDNLSETGASRLRLPWQPIAVVALILILALAAYFRFTGIDWDESYHLHPDERFLTDVATLLQTTDPLTYLKTSESTLNPYNVGKTFYVYGNFPMTVTRFVAEFIDIFCVNVGDGCSQQRFIYFDGIQLVGRALSALFDLASIVFIYLIGQRLYNWRAGLIGSLLMAAAVLPIQQSHFFTMDNWAAAMTTITMYAAVRASQNGRQIGWWALFGLGLGLAVASRINLAPLAVMSGVAAFVWLAQRATKDESSQGWRYVLTDVGSVDLQRVFIGLVIAAGISIVVFRLAQPYAFADGNIVRDTVATETGESPGTIETAIKSLVGFNPLWRANMAEIQGLQSPDASFPPALQWTNRTPFVFPFTNIVLWGLGLTAGLAGWAGFVWALWRVIRVRPDWSSHIMLVTWIGLYFIFMASRWVKSVRYFLPIYPFLLLLAGWALVELWNRAGQNLWKRVGVALLAAIVIIPTILWANSFVGIYQKPVTRVQASEWIFDQVPSGATLLYESDDQSRELQLPLRRFDFYPDGIPLVMQFELPEDGLVTGVRFNYLSDPDEDLTTDNGESLHISILDPTGIETLSEAGLAINLARDRQSVTFDMPAVSLTTGNRYTLLAESGPGGPITASTSILANEHWDDSLPVRLSGRDPFSMYYEGVAEGQIPITHPDNEEKRQSFYRWLDESDYIVLSSQRAMWSLPRLPLTFPLTSRYYEALFNNELGFELVEQFHADLKVGPLYISDVAGAVSWGSPVELGWPPPGDFAAEEAFSVYDHPPVWVFAKSDDYTTETVRQVLDKVDLSNAIFMTPGQATQAPNGLMLSQLDGEVQQDNGSFGTIFAVDGILSQNSWLAAVIWWLAVLLLGWLVFPLTFIVFRGLADRGYPFARILSLLLISYFVWLMASLRILPHTRSTIILGLLLLSIVSVVIAFSRRREILSFIQSNLSLIAVVELVSLGLYLIFIIIRLGNPDVWDVIWGGEKPMDLSYFNAVLKSSVFPPYDPWYAGGYINYYYYGFVYVGVLTKLLGIVPAVAYNLILPMIASFTGIGAFSIAFNLVSAGRSRRSKQDPNSAGELIHSLISRIKTPAVAAGVIAAVLIVLIGNLAEIKVVVNAWQRAGDIEAVTGFEPADTVLRTIDGGVDILFTEEVAPIYPGDWFWSATRIINFEPGEVQPITEFPFFTFLYGDLHAHMISLPLTLMALAWAVSLVLFGGRDKSSSVSPKKWEWLLIWLVGGLAIGVLRATNTWDFPTFLFLGVLAVGYSVYLESGRLDLKTLGTAALQIAAIVALSVIFFLPFAENYGVPYTSFSLWPGSYTRLPNYFLVYGLFLFFIITHLILEFRSWTRTWSGNALNNWERYILPIILALILSLVLSIYLLVQGYWIAPFVLALVIVAGLLGLRPGLPIERRIVLVLISSALALTLLVEFIVLDGDIGRMNTVFKFYMQVWVILSAICGAIAVWVWPAIMARKTLSRVWGLALIFLVAAAALYPILATKAKWDIRMSDEAPTTLDGMAFMTSTTYADTALDGSSQTIRLDFDYEALLWMQRNIAGSPVIVEAHGTNPYRSIASRVSMYTGLPGIIGWDWHQRQQRAVLPASVVGNRINDVNTLFNTTNSSEALSILEKYDVSYVYVGPLEWTYYNPQGLLKFERMVDEGLIREVYRNEGVSIYEVVA